MEKVTAEVCRGSSRPGVPRPHGCAEDRARGALHELHQGGESEGRGEQGIKTRFCKRPRINHDSNSYYLSKIKNSKKVLKEAFDDGDQRESMLDSVPVGKSAPSMPSESAIEAAQKRQSFKTAEPGEEEESQSSAQEKVDSSSVSQAEMPGLEPTE